MNNGTIHSLHFSPTLYSIAVPDAILGNRSLRCSNSCIHVVVRPQLSPRQPVKNAD
jgi:hypothetical protein